MQQLIDHIENADALLKRVQPFLANLGARIEVNQRNAKSVFDARYWGDALKTIEKLKVDIDLHLDDDPEEEDEG